MCLARFPTAGRRRPARRDPARVRRSNPTAGRMARVASSSRPITARASTATGRRTSPSPGASPITSGRVTRPRGSPCRGGASWPRSTGATRQGRRVPLDQQPVTGYLRGATAMAETEFPTTRGTDRQGWTEVSDTYQAPSRATRAIVELHLRWATGRQGALERRVADRDQSAAAADGAAGHRPLQAQRRQDARRTTAGCTSR